MAGGADDVGVALLTDEPEAPDFVSSLQPIIAAHNRSATRENFFMIKTFREPSADASRARHPWQEHPDHLGLKPVGRY